MTSVLVVLTAAVFALCAGVANAISCNVCDSNGFGSPKCTGFVQRDVNWCVAMIQGQYMEKVYLPSSTRKRGALSSPLLSNGVPAEGCFYTSTPYIMPFFDSNQFSAVCQCNSSDFCLEKMDVRAQLQRDLPTVKCHFTGRGIDDANYCSGAFERKSGQLVQALGNAGKYIAFAQSEDELQLPICHTSTDGDYTMCACKTDNCNDASLLSSVKMMKPLIKCYDSNTNGLVDASYCFYDYQFHPPSNYATQVTQTGILSSAPLKSHNYTEYLNPYSYELHATGICDTDKCNELAHIQARLFGQ